MIKNTKISMTVMKIFQEEIEKLSQINLIILFASFNIF